jgi:hypothetical protein
MAASLFERLRPAPIKSTPIESTPSTEAAAESLLEKLEAERPLPPPIDERDTPLERLQRFLRRWRKPTIRLREICIFGPKSDRNRQTVLNLVQELVEQGRLTPIVTNRRNVQKWKIIPKGQRPTAALKEEAPLGTTAQYVGVTPQL